MTVDTRIMRGIRLPAPLWPRIKRACANREIAGERVSMEQWIEEAVRAQLAKEPSGDDAHNDEEIE